MEKSDGTEERETVRTAEKRECIGKAAPLSEGRQTAAETVSQEKIYGSRTIRKVETIMKKTIFEEIGGTYIRHGDYLIPCLTLLEEEQRFIGVWGQRHKRYLKEHKRAIYITLLTSGKLNSYLADIEEQAQGDYRTVKDRKSDGMGSENE